MIMGHSARPMPHPPVVVISTASMKALVAAGASGGGGFKGGMAVSFFGLPPDAFNDMVTDMEDVDRGSHLALHLH